MNALKSMILAPLILATGLAAGVTPAYAQQDRQSYSLSAKVGALLPGTIYVNDDDFESDAGFFSWVDADAMVASRLSVGVAGLVATTSSGDEGATIFAAGPTLKARFTLGSVHLRPGLLLAYQVIDSDSLEETITGFNAGLLVEAAFGMGATRPVVQVGFISQPTGGSDCCDVSFGPIFYVTGGVEFGE